MLVFSCHAHMTILPTHSRWLKSLAKQRTHTKPTVIVAELGCDTPWFGSRERISERIDEQVVDHSRLEAARADVAEAEKNPTTQVASDHEEHVKTMTEELKTLSDATKMLQQGTRGAG